MTVTHPGRTWSRLRSGAVAVAFVLTLGVLAPAVAGADPSSTPSAAPPVAAVETTTQTCAGYTITAVARPDALSADRPAAPPPSLTVTAPDGSIVVRWQGRLEHDESAHSLDCRDVDADGRPELLYSEDSGGMHCCSTFVLLRLETPATELLRVNLLDAWSFVPSQLDASPALELVAADLRLEYMGDLPYIVTSPFPRIFAFDGERYVDATRSYPASLRADRKKALHALAACAVDSPDGDAVDCQKAVGLRIVALDILLGTGATGISKLPLDAATRQWLQAIRAEVARALATP